jgi:hypothetical protein
MDAEFNVHRMGRLIATTGSTEVASQLHANRTDSPVLLVTAPSVSGIVLACQDQPSVSERNDGVKWGKHIHFFSEKTIITLTIGWQMVTDPSY